MYMKNYRFKHKSRMQDYIFQRPTLTTTHDGNDGKLAHGKWLQTSLNRLDIITIFDITYNLYRSLLYGWSVCRDSVADPNFQREVIVIYNIILYLTPSHWRLLYPLYLNHYTTIIKLYTVIYFFSRSIR